MPIFKQTYRSFDGQARDRGRWRIVMEQEFRVLFKMRPFIILLIAGEIQCLLRLLQIVAHDIVMQDPNNPLTMQLQHVRFIMVDAQMFFDFIRLQAPVVFLMCVYAGSGMINNDVRNNLMEVYFSKPLRWYDYALGKILTLVVVGLVLTAIPGVFLVLLHNLFLPGAATFQATWWLPFAITGFSLLIILPCALGALACSAMVSSQRYASIAIFMVLIADSAVGGMLAGMLRDPNYLIISFPMALNRVGQAMFQARRTFFEMHWGYGVAFAAAVCLLSLVILLRQVRRAEVAR